MFVSAIRHVPVHVYRYQSALLGRARPEPDRAVSAQTADFRIGGLAEKREQVKEFPLARRDADIVDSRCGAGISGLLARQRHHVRMGAA